MVTAPSCALWGSRLTTARMQLPGTCFAYAINPSFWVSSQKTFDRICSAGFSCRISLSRRIIGSSGPSSARSRASYFSEFRYSSLPSRTGTFSKLS